MSFRSVATYAFPGLGSFGLGVVSELFGFDRTGRGQPGFDFSLCADRPGPVRTDAGFSVVAEHGLDRLASADLVCLTSWGGSEWEPSPELLGALTLAYDRGATILSSCTGAFILAGTGLLDGRRATTHWRHARNLADRFPRVRVEPEVLYVDEGRLITGAGCAATVDAGLYLLRREFGASVAASFARDMVVPPHRTGGQAQYVSAPIPADCDDERLNDVLAWARANLDQRLTVDRLAARAVMSPRSFARQFKAVTGTTPRAWLLAERLQRAEELLESADLPIEEISRRVGFGTSAALREQFVRRRGVSPRDYRRAFTLNGAGPNRPTHPEPAPATERPSPDHDGALLSGHDLADHLPARDLAGDEQPARGLRVGE